MTDRERDWRVGIGVNRDPVPASNPCQAEDDEATMLTQEMKKAQLALNNYNSARAEKEINQYRKLMEDHIRQIAELEAKEAKGEKGHRREIGELKEDVEKIKKRLAAFEAERKRLNDALLEAIARMEKANKALAECKKKHGL